MDQPLIGINNFLLERYFARWEFSVPYNLCASDCESISIDELLSLEPESRTAFNKLHLGYTESLGHPDLRREIASLYESVDFDQIIVFSGAEEAILLLIHALLVKGDSAIVQFPAYQSLYAVGDSIGAEVDRFSLVENDGWTFAVEALRERIKPNTKLLVLNFPHNPTGCHITAQEQALIRDIAAENGVSILSDEVYRFAEYNPQDQLPAMVDIYEKAISLGVMSKSFGLAGLRIGWLAIKDRNLFNRIASLKDYTTICNSAPSEFLATIALRQKEKILQRNLHIIKSNLTLLEDFFALRQEFFKWNRPGAGPIAYPRLLLDESSETFCAGLADKAGVLLLPSTVYEHGNSHFRIGFGRANMPEALARLDDYLDKY